MSREAYIFEAVRTPRAVLKKGNTSALAAVKPVQLLGVLLEALKTKRNVDPDAVDDVIVGCATQVGDQGGNVAKTALLAAGWPERIPGQMVNRQCISGLEAVAIGAAKIQSGQCDVVLAGGVESMSRVPTAPDEGGALLPPMGVSADLIASLDNRTREELDVYVLESHARASRAPKSTNVIPAGLLTEDDGVRPDLTKSKLAALSPAFGDDDGKALIATKYPNVKRKPLHTSATSAQAADGACFILLATLEAGKAMGLDPKARVESYAALSSDPITMFTGASHATRRALDKASSAPSDISVYEHNENFAAACLRFQHDMDADPWIINPHGGAFALGHPRGATGSILIATLLEELTRRSANRGAVAMSTTGGLAASMVVTRS